MITDLRLQHYRSYKDETFEFEPHVNIIVGPNASGKTNLLEAILYSAQGTSYRAKDTELIAHGEKWARLDAHSGDSVRTVKLELQPNESVIKKFEIDSQTYMRLSMQKKLPVVLFEPNHLQLLHGSPELRRNYLDDLLEQTVAGFGTLRRQYKRALAQRNALLKRGYDVAALQLFAWDIRLSELGGQIAVQRTELVSVLNKSITELYDGISHTNTTVRLEYASKVNTGRYSSDLLQKLEAHARADCERGFTAYGPHRDDMVLWLNDYLGSETASRGETRTALLALKILELQQLEQARDDKPLLLLDDVFSELDGARRQALTSFLAPYQTFITTTDADVVVQHFMGKCNIIPLS